MDQLTLIIKTHERPKSLIRLLKSIRIFAKNYPIIIADDSDKPSRNEILRLFPDLRIAYFITPNNGINYGRTLMAKFSKTDYILLLDDDYEFSVRTRLEGVFEIIKLSNIDLVCGLITEFPDYSLVSTLGMIKELFYNKNLRRFYNYLFNKPVIGAWIKFEGDKVSKFYTYSSLMLDINYNRITYGPNFFLIRKKTLEEIGYWDSEDYPPYDHSNFFKKMEYNSKVMKLDYEFQINHISKRTLKYYLRRNFL
jgi:hypothetical protein